MQCVHLQFHKRGAPEPDSCVTDLCRHLSATPGSAACGEQTPTRRRVSTTCISRCFLSSFELSGLGRSKRSREHHQAALLDAGGLFNRRYEPPSDGQVVELDGAQSSSLRPVAVIYRSALTVDTAAVRSTQPNRMQEMNFQAFQESTLCVCRGFPLVC